MFEFFFININVTSKKYIYTKSLIIKNLISLPKQEYLQHYLMLLEFILLCLMKNEINEKLFRLMKRNYVTYGPAITKALL